MSLTKVKCSGGLPHKQVGAGALRDDVCDIHRNGIAAHKAVCSETLLDGLFRLRGNRGTSLCGLSDGVGEGHGW